MRTTAVVIGCMILLAGSVSAQTYRTFTLGEVADAEECDCTGDCPTLTVPGGGRYPISKFSVSVEDFRESLGVDLRAALVDPGVSLDGAYLEFSTDPTEAPVVLDRDGEVETFLKPGALARSLDQTDWFKERSVELSILGNMGVDRVVEPVLKKGFPVPVLPRERNLCRIAVGSSRTSATRECSDAIAALCPRGVGDASCTLASIRRDINRGNDSRTGALVKYDQACLRSDVPASGPSSFDFALIAGRTGVLKIDLGKATADCQTIGESLSEGAAFCSAVAIGPNKILTARHCVVSKNRDWSDTGSCLAQDAVQFATLANPDRSVRVQAVADPGPLFARTKAEDDYVVLTLASPLPNVTGDILRIRPDNFSPAVIMAHHELASPDQSIAGPSWRQRVRWSRPQCSFTHIAGACGVTNCQTIEGYSGAPVWVQDEAGNTGLAGLQVGGGSADLRTCAPASTSSFIPANANFAIWGYHDDPNP